MIESDERKTALERDAEAEGMELDEKFRVGYKRGKDEGARDAFLACSVLMNLALFAVIVSLLVWG